MRIITIDKYIFAIENNIQNLEKKLKINYDIQRTIKKPVYTHLGGYDEEFRFEANILLDDVAKFKGFEELIKEARPLKISAFDLVEYKYILINELNISVEKFYKRQIARAWYYAKNMQISGFIIG